MTRDCHPFFIFEMYDCGVSQVLPQILSYKEVFDASGNLRILDLPFLVKRIYTIENVPKGESRGFHAQKTLKQRFCMIQGEMEIDLSTPSFSQTFQLSKAKSSVLYIEPGYWRELYNFSSNAICLVLASEIYDESDYFRSYEDYSQWFSRNDFE